MTSKRLNNIRIGRPPVKVEEMGFRKNFEKHKVRFELESQLLLLIYDLFHLKDIEETGNDTRITQQQLTEVFSYFAKKELYQVLQKNNKSYFENEAQLREEEKPEYTSIIDISYLFRVVKQWKLGLDPPELTLKNYDIFLTFLFYLNNEKLVNEKFLCYFCPRMEASSFVNMMFEGPSLFADDLSLLIVMDKQKIIAERQRMITPLMYPPLYPINFMQMPHGNPIPVPPVHLPAYEMHPRTLLNSSLQQTTSSIQENQGARMSEPEVALSGDIGLVPRRHKISKIKMRKVGRAVPSVPRVIKIEEDE